MYLHVSESKVDIDIFASLINSTMLALSSFMRRTDGTGEDGLSGPRCGGCPWG